ncbi:ATP12 family chaperone protein [Roseovarius sp. D22-M7]|uniref:ATP12 family chaperone protein n=1 Tax=Roseovarius sp. D22-M7 TaxID=3127116 RepID=UPI0030102F58
MSEWAAKRFWTAATVAELAEGYTVHLDGRPVRTPAKAPVVLPTRALAAEIAAEWDAQAGEIVPASMPVTRAANATIDKVAHQHAEMARMLADYGDSDLLCYRADSPAELAARQAEAWDPLLDWAESELSARLETRTGLMPRPQHPETLDRLHREVEMLDNWAMTAFHDLVGISGSLIIGFAALRGAWPAHTLWQVSRLDEVWQQEQWGKDEDADRVARAKERDFVNAKRFHDLSRG